MRVVAGNCSDRALNWANETLFDKVFDFSLGLEQKNLFRRGRLDCQFVVSLQIVWDEMMSTKFENRSKLIPLWVCRCEWSSSSSFSSFRAGCFWTWFTVTSLSNRLLPVFSPKTPAQQFHHMHCERLTKARWSRKRVLRPAVDSVHVYMFLWFVAVRPVGPPTNRDRLQMSFSTVKLESFLLQPSLSNELFPSCCHSRDGLSYAAHEYAFYLRRLDWVW